MAPLQPLTVLCAPAVTVLSATNTTIGRSTIGCPGENPSSLPALTNFTTNFFTHNQTVASSLKVSEVFIIFGLVLLFIFFVGIILNYFPSFLTHEEILDHSDELMAPYSYEYKLDSPHQAPSKVDESETSALIKKLKAEELEGDLSTIDDATELKAFCEIRGYGTFSEKAKTLNMLMERDDIWVVTLE